MNGAACPFCSPAPDRVFYRDALVVGLWDAFPVTPGHALLVPVRHVATWFEATMEERAALMRATDAARLAIEASHATDGYNIGINSGRAAGQTVFHLHVHVIPRRDGDSPDPRGGVRHVFPERANYVRDSAQELTSPYAPSSSSHALVTGGSEDPLLPQIKDHLARSDAADIVEAFTLRSGLALIQPHLQDLLDRQGTIRVLTGDYLGATDPDALLRLLDLNGQIERRIFQSDGKSATGAFAGAFHPKAYVFHHRDGSGAAFIGSSNLSASALTSGVEWNYRVLESRDQNGWQQIRDAFEALLVSPNTVSLTPEWIERYRSRRPTISRVAPAEIETDPPVQAATPHVIQEEALAALRETRAAGRKAGLVVLATGLGKTWLSAFDSLPFHRVLFVAHREEILEQALTTYRAIRPHDAFGRYSGSEKSSTAAVLFASIQTLGRQAHLDRFARDEFDYIVVDEFHHAEARTYRRLIEHFTPNFLLGLTATPERTDGADLLSLCEDNLVYRCDLPTGIRLGLLCPFHYFGVPDTVDYRNIPWRNKRFDENELTKAVATHARAENALDQFRRRAGSRTIAFCVSQRHADFMAEYFGSHGIRAKAVHAGATSAPRAESLEKLRAGSLSVICAVDMFNEGVDVPELDTVMMLRPTESRILWLQQFGRGLRRIDADKTLTVIDYIGNHRSFLLKPQALFGLPPGDREVLNLFERLDAGTADLPPGCEVTYELEAKDILRQLLRTGGSAVELLTRRFQDFRDSLGVRPTAAEMFREGYNPRVMRSSYGSWLGFVKAEGGLEGIESQSYLETRVFLENLEITAMTKSFKMLVLLAMLNRGKFPGSIGLTDLASEVADLARRDARVSQDLGEAISDRNKLERLLRDNPIAAWIDGRGTGGVSYFEFVDDEFKTRFSVTAVAINGAQELVRELTEWRLAEYFARPGQGGTTDFALRVSHADGRPILFLPDRESHPGLPEGWTDVEVDGEVLHLNIVKVAVNVARRQGSEENVLPELLEHWFGPDVGKPGTRHQVRLRQELGVWTLRPAGVSVAGAIPYKAYRRAEVAPLFGLRYSERYWGQGFVLQPGHMFLFVTLDKSDHAEAFKYEDHFLSADTIQWQSQNRTTQASETGKAIAEHKSRGIAVHLFVRARAKTSGGQGAPFYYCGPVEFVSWAGDKPITVTWRLTAAVPRALWAELGITAVGEPKAT